MTRTEIINIIAEKIKAESYLEIGVWNGVNFQQISIKNKIGVDPYAEVPVNYPIGSDDFFEGNNQMFDVIFIDGLHHADQVERDILNSLKFLNENGAIVCHDLNPIEESRQIIPFAGGAWNGDCWKAWVKLRSQRSDLEMFVVDTDHGCGVIRKGSQNLIEVTEEINYKNFDINRKNWLNLISIEDFKKIYVVNEQRDTIKKNQLKKNMKIVDCFTYFNEQELLELRINLLKDIVDHFIIVDADRTHTGKPKEFTCNKTIDELGLPRDKITVIEASLPSKESNDNDYVRENMQRNIIADHIDYATIAIITDCDEIIDPKFVKYYASIIENNPNNILRIPMAFLCSRGDLRAYNLNGSPVGWAAGFVCMKHHLDRYTASEIRESYSFEKHNLVYKDIFAIDNGIIEEAGWHLSWMGDNNRKKLKYQSFVHNSEEIYGAVEKSYLEQFIDNYNAGENSTDPLGRNQYVLKKYDISKLPSIALNSERVKNFLIPTDA